MESGGTEAELRRILAAMTNLIDGARSTRHGTLSNLIGAIQTNYKKRLDAEVLPTPQDLASFGLVLDWLEEGDINPAGDKLDKATQLLDEITGKAKPQKAPAPKKAPIRKTLKTSQTQVSQHQVRELLQHTDELSLIKLGLVRRNTEVHRLRTELSEWRRDLQSVTPEYLALRRRLLETEDIELQSLLDIMEESHEYLRSLERQVEQLSRQTYYEHRAATGLVDRVRQRATGLFSVGPGAFVQRCGDYLRKEAKEKSQPIELKLSASDFPIDQRVLDLLWESAKVLLDNTLDSWVPSSGQTKVAR